MDYSFRLLPGEGEDWGFPHGYDDQNCKRNLREAILISGEGCVRVGHYMEDGSMRPRVDHPNVGILTYLTHRFVAEQDMHLSERRGRHLGDEFHR